MTTAGQEGREHPDLLDSVSSKTDTDNSEGGILSWLLVSETPSRGETRQTCNTTTDALIDKTVLRNKCFKSGKRDLAV